MTEHDSPLPAAVIEEAERLTRLARRSDGDEAKAYRSRRDRLLAEYGFEARVREDDDSDVLVCHPAEWLDDGTVRLGRIEDTSRAVERPLSTSNEDFEVVERDNRKVVARVRDQHGPAHEANVRAFADFLGNHHATRISEATSEHVAEFRAEYYPRNVWPSDEERALLEDSLRLAFEYAGVEQPPL